MMNPDWAKQFESAMEGLERLKKKGMIRAHGISSHSNAATVLAAETPWVDTIHLRINSEGMNMDGTGDAAERVKQGVAAAEKAHKAGKGIIAMKLIGEGKLADKPELRKKSIKFVSSLDCIDVMIVGFTEKEHIMEFLDSVEG
jgi:predicted aldo/keto reductase-like oxidoreductase